jgi:hypothetical protein
MRSVRVSVVGLIVLFCIGCANNKTSKHHQTPIVDTFYLCNRLVERDSITKVEFEKSPAIAYDTSEAGNLRRDSTAVKRHGDSLILNIGSKQIILVNNSSDNSDSFADYRYLGLNKQIDKYIVFCSLWEWYHYLLVDKQTGDTTITCGEPVVSPDSKLFICGNSDLVAQFTFNGIELYENGHKPKMLCQRELYDWGPKDIKWITQNELLVEADVFTDTANKTDTRTTWYKLMLK